MGMHLSTRALFSVLVLAGLAAVLASAAPATSPKPTRVSASVDYVQLNPCFVVPPSYGHLEVVAYDDDPAIAPGLVRPANRSRVDHSHPRGRNHLGARSARRHGRRGRPLHLCCDYELGHRLLALRRWEPREWINRCVRPRRCCDERLDALPVLQWVLVGPLLPHGREHQDHDRVLRRGAGIERCEEGESRPSGASLPSSRSMCLVDARQDCDARPRRRSVALPDCSAEMPHDGLQIAGILREDLPQILDVDERTSE